MKIGSISFYNTNNTQNVVCKTKYAPMFNVGVQDPIGRVPLTSDQVSFTGMPIPFFLKNIRGFHCPCCGVKMPATIDIIEKLTENALSSGSKKAVEALSEFEECMHPVEKSAFQLIKEESKKAPEKDLQDILISLRPEYFKKLKATQFQIFDKMEETGKTLSSESFKKLKEITERARNVITCQGNHDSFKRKTMIESITKLKGQIPEKHVAEKLTKIVQTLPTSSDDLSAFVVKYCERGSKEIGQRLVDSASGTVEHIHPHSLRGASDDANYMLECKGCNNPRGNQVFPEFVKDNPGMVHNIPEGTDMGGLSVEEWVKAHPEHKGNVQKHFDEVIEKMNNGEITDHNWYPAIAAKTLEEESKGAIKIDVSQLKNPTILDKKPLVDKFNVKATAKEEKRPHILNNKNTAKPIATSKPVFVPKEKPQADVKPEVKTESKPIVKPSSPEKKEDVQQKSAKKFTLILKKNIKAVEKPPVEKDDEPVNIFRPRNKRRG